MSITYDFLKESGVFYLSTVNVDAPALRPFGAVMEYENNLYISTANTKEVYKQMKENQNIQIVALKLATREWIRVNGKAVEFNDIIVKSEMFKKCPVLSTHFKTANNPQFALFQITNMKSYINSQQGITKVD